jgi:hypothetical protein
MHKICFTISLFHAFTCFEHHVLIVRRSKLYYTASGIIIPIGGLPVHGTATYRYAIKGEKRIKFWYARGKRIFGHLSHETYLKILK